MRVRTSPSLASERVRAAAGDDEAADLRVLLKFPQGSLQLAKQLQLDLTGARNTRTVLDKASAAGFDKEYFPALMKVI